MMLEACFGVGSFALDKAIKTTIEGLFLEAAIPHGGIGVQEKLPGTFLWSKSINESSLKQLLI